VAEKKGLGTEIEDSIVGSSRESLLAGNGNPMFPLVHNPNFSRFTLLGFLPSELLFLRPALVLSSSGRVSGMHHCIPASPTQANGTLPFLMGMNGHSHSHTQLVNSVAFL